jgi:hypothetical protein
MKLSEYAQWLATKTVPVTKHVAYDFRQFVPLTAPEIKGSSVMANRAAVARYAAVQPDEFPGPVVRR